MTVEPFKRITKVTQDIANNWQKYYVCMEKIDRPPNVSTYDEQKIFYDRISLWRGLLWRSSDQIFARPLVGHYRSSASVYESGWVLIERKDSVEVGVLVDHNEDLTPAHRATDRK